MVQSKKKEKKQKLACYLKKGKHQKNQQNLLKIMLSVICGIKKTNEQTLLNRNSHRYREQTDGCQRGGEKYMREIRRYKH